VFDGWDPQKVIASDLRPGTSFLTARLMRRGRLGLCEFSCIYPAIFLVLKHCRRHSPESWKELWERVIFPASRLEQHGGGGDEVRVWVTAGFQADQKLGPNDRSRQLQWSVVII